MDERCRTIETDFSVADAEYPILELRDGVLTLSYTDWQEKPVIVVFNDVIAVRWQEVESLIEGERFDGASIVEHSKWLEDHVNECKVDSNHDYKHFKFNFNACGSLEVLCTDFRRSDV
jgi:hypothetical protein